MSSARGLLLYDADCGFCTRSAAQVPRLGVDVDIAPMQSVDLAAYGVDAQRASQEMPFVNERGAVTYGHVAWAEVLRTGPWPCRLAGRAMTSRVLNPLAARVYRWVGTHRHLLPGGTATCGLSP